MLQGTCDIWQVTTDTWHMTNEMWRMVGVNMTHKGWWTLCQIVRSLALTVWERQCVEDIFQKITLLLAESVMEVLVEQLRLHWVSLLQRLYSQCYSNTNPRWDGNKLDGVGPIDNRPSTYKLHHKKRKKSDMWHGTHETWHVTHDTWHMTCDVWHVTCCGGWTFSQNFSFLALLVCDLWYFEDLEQKAHGLSELMNDKVDCRTAPATPGLLNKVFALPFYFEF